MLHRKIFWLLLLLLPIQLGRHFWSEFAFIFGIRVDYLSPTVYVTDLVVVGLLITWVLDKWLHGYMARWLQPFNHLAILTIYLLFSSLFIAQNQGAAIYKSAKVLEFFLLGVYVYSNSSWILKTRMFSLPLSLAIIYSSTIAVLQFLKQETLGGVFWFLGERTFTINTPGIALESLFNQEFLRPYSIFPHPNVLAGFLLVAGLLLYPWRTHIEKVALGVGLVVLTLSFSQGAWLAGSLLLVLWLIRKNKTTFSFFIGLLFGGIILTTLLPVFVPPAFSINFAEEIKMRHELSWTAGHMIKDNPLAGVGLNNFINRLPAYGLSPAVSWWLQPVHNVYLLIASEMGLLFFVILVYLFVAKMDSGWWKVDGLRLALLAIFITGTFDHYWFTLQQTQILSAIVFGFILSLPKDLS